MRRLLSLSLYAIVATAMVLPAGCAAPRSEQVEPTAAAICEQRSVSVNVSATDPTAYRIVGWLCLSPDAQRGTKTVQLLVSGLTYDHTYWDAEYQPDTYSYVRTALAHGYSTFNIDRLGVGKSDRPPADRLTLQAHAHTISQIVAQLRSGAIGPAFQTVVGVGHSMGAGILQYEAGTVTDKTRVPDYLILADFLFKADPAVVARIGAALYPAAEDPGFASAGLPAGYLTTRPGTRRDLFFAPGSADPALVTMDETAKQTSTLAERTTLGAARDMKVLLAIQIPILLTVGQHDSLACGEALGLSCATPAAVVEREASHFSPKACLSAYVQAGAGHSANLHRNARDAYDYSNEWIDRYTVDGADQKDANGCLL